MSEDRILPGERILGCLLGMATGDALGAPLQGMKGGRVEQLLGRVEDYVDADAAHPDKPGRWTPKGLHTANTQFALALGDALLLVGQDAREEFIENIERLASRGEGPYGALRGLSADLRAAIGCLRESSKPPRSLSPGPAAWIAPLGIFAFSHVEQIDPALLAGSLAGVVTGDIRTISAAAVCAEAVRRCLAGECDAADCGGEAAEGLSGWAHGAEERLSAQGFDCGEDSEAGLHAVSQTLSVIAPSLRENNDDLARRSILAEASRHSSERLSDDVQAPFAPANVAWALYLALKQRRFDVPVEHALSGGRCASDIAAVIGAIQGARLGAGAIPSPWSSGLLARDLIAGRAAAYFEGDIAAIYENDLCRAEAAWSQMESEGRARRFAAVQESQKKRDERKQGKKKTPSAPAPPPTTYARVDLPAFDNAPDPEKARKDKAQRGRKRIDWKEDRRKRSRRGD
jgi:ADP-ribosylglycohydrolase